MTPDPESLRTELASDPLNLGYAPLILRAQDQSIADILNDRAGPGSASIALATVPRDDFLKGIRGAYLRLPALSAAIQAKWDRILHAINTGDGVTIDAGTMLLLGSAVQDGVLLQVEADATWHRTGSRAEVLFGAGTIVTATQVGAAR